MKPTRLHRTFLSITGLMLPILLMMWLQAVSVSAAVPIYFERFIFTGLAGWTVENGNWVWSASGSNAGNTGDGGSLTVATAGEIRSPLITVSELQEQQSSTATVISHHQQRHRSRQSNGRAAMARGRNGQ